MTRLYEIQEKGFHDQFEFSRHAVDQSIIRDISVREVKEAINPEAKIIEDYPKDKYGPSCLILGFTRQNRPLHVQCSYPSRPVLKIVTLYEPDPEKWINFEKTEKSMSTAEEKLTERKVTYSLELDGKFYIVENVPARVNEETGEQYFAPETVEHLRQKIRGNAHPKKTMETPVFDYSD